MDQAEQPDFGRIQQSFVALGDQFALCANIPAATEGVSISRQLETITVSIREISARVQQVDARVQQVDARVSQLDIRLDGHMNQINTRMAAEAANRLYCNENKAATVPDSGLQPLLDVQTGQPIEGFPETLGAIDALNGERIHHGFCVPLDCLSTGPYERNGDV
ncbi:hypothetical protein HYQ46_011610 [Verticillium longisporum]|nr:hypothetical protein HYQ46_011610 [Verticillium longisporum]